MAKLLKDVIQDKLESDLFNPKQIIADFKEQTGYELEYDGDQGFTYKGSLYLGGKNVKSLPDNLMVRGHLDLRATEITSLPDNLTVRGSLYLNGTKIKSLPDNLTIGDDLYLNGTKIKSLPDNLSAVGTIYKDF